MLDETRLWFLILAEWIADPWVIGGVALLLVYWSLHSGYRLWHSVKVLERACRSATERVLAAETPTEFARHYEDTTAALAANGTLGSAWREYAETLVLPRDTELIRNTVRPSEYFDIGLLRGLGTDLRYHEALPNLLVGAGLLFTFLGLAIALSVAGGSVAAADPDDARGALQQLLAVASFKFITSLVGLLCSILYALWRKWMLKRAERAIQEFNEALEERLDRITPETLAATANQELERQTGYLAAFTNDLAVSLGEAFDRAFDTRLGEHIQPLTDAMQSLSEKIASMNQETMDEMLKGFIQELRAGAGTEMQSVGATLREVGNNLDNLISGLTAAQESMVGAAQAMTESMGKGADDALLRIGGRMEELVGALQSMTEETRAAGAGAGEELARQLTTATEQMSAAVAEASRRAQVDADASAAHIRRQVDALAAAIGEAGAATAKAGEAASNEMMVRLAQASATLEQAASSLRESVQTGAEEFAARVSASGAEIRSATDSLSKAMERADDAMAQSATALSEHRAAMAATTETLRQVAAELTSAARTAAEIASPLGEAADEMSSTADTLAEVTERARELQTTVTALAGRLVEVGGRFEGLDRSLGATLESLQGGLREFTRTVQEFMQSTNADLATATNLLGSAIADLEGTVADLADALPERPLAQSAPSRG